MATNLSKRQVPKPKGSVIEWLLDSDPSIRWQAMRDMGLDPMSEAARGAVTRVRDNVTWQGVLPQDAAWHGKPLFAGEVEPCINGRVVTVGSYFGQDAQSEG